MQGLNKKHEHPRHALTQTNIHPVQPELAGMDPVPYGPNHESLVWLDAYSPEIDDTP
jgi:hypothetical protein